MKRFLTILFALVMCFVFVVACADDPAPAPAPEAPAPAPEDPAPEEPAPEDPAPAPDTDVTLFVQFWDDGQRPGLQQIMDVFTARTGIGVDFEIVGWGEYWTALEAGAMAGTLPDVFLMHSNVVQDYMDFGFLLDLTDRIAGSDLIDTANYPADIVGLYTWEGRIFAIPKDIDTIALWYNRTMFEEAGIATPDATWTWEDALEAAIALTTDDVYGFALHPDMNQVGWYNIIYSFDGWVISPDKTTSGYGDPNTLAAMDMVERFIQAGVMPSAGLMAETGEPDLFTSGAVAMTTMGSWMLAYMMGQDADVREASDVAVLPMGPGGRRVSVFNGLGWVVAESTDHPDEAWQLIEWMGSQEAQLMQADLGVTMSAFHGTSNNWVNAPASAYFNIQAYLDMMDDMVILPFSRETFNWENMQVLELTRVWEQEVGMREAMAYIEARMNAYLAAEG